jgi:hypothetical protein
VAFTSDDLTTLTALVADAWRSGLDRDWSAPAGDLEWSCTKTADHTVDTVLAPAFFLASRKQDAYPEFGAFSPGSDARPDLLVEALETAARILIAVVTAAEPDARAVIWRRPQVELRGPADFVPRGGFELALHGHDVCTGLGVAFRPPTGLCERLREHTRAWPYWSSPGWSPPTMTGDPWTDLVVSSGRRPPDRT